MLMLEAFWIRKRSEDLRNYKKRDQRNLVGLSVSNTKLTIRQVIPESNIAIKVSIHTIRKILRKCNLNELISTKSPSLKNLLKRKYWTKEHLL